jgi:hypothetical protein
MRPEPPLLGRRPTRQQQVDGGHTRFVERLVERGLAAPPIAPTLVAETVTGIVMRFAEDAAAQPERHAELADALVALYVRLSALAP